MGRIECSLEHSVPGAAQRLARVAIAFTESAIATSAALEVVVVRLYHDDPDGLARVCRIASTAVRIGEECGLDGKTLADLERAALLHDVGRLVLKGDPGPVAPDMSDDATRRAEQRRTVAEMTRPWDFLRPAGAIVAASAECFDGSGRPLGLRGAEIPVGARILCVADAMDSLASLCLALGYPIDAANAELVLHAGSRLDPDVVAAWLRCSRELSSPGLTPWPSAAERAH
jgi:response regulator RpfG family c-di-GMP phosphodiesterase